MQLLEPVVLLLTFGGGVVTSLMTLIVRDAVLKNSLKHKITALEELKVYWERVNERQDSEITRLREDQLTTRERQSNLRERVDSIYENDIKVMKEMLQTVQQQGASLDATLKGLTGWLKRVDEKLDKLK